MVKECYFPFCNGELLEAGTPSLEHCIDVLMTHICKTAYFNSMTDDEYEYVLHQLHTVGHFDDYWYYSQYPITIEDKEEECNGCERCSCKNRMPK